MQLQKPREGSNRCYHNRETDTFDRVARSKILFEKTDKETNLYIDDRLETKREIVIYNLPYNLETAVESANVRCLSRYDIKQDSNIKVVGYLEMDEWDEKNDCIYISKLYVAPEYRRKGYASKMLGRLIECGEYHNVRKISLFACADKGIKQDDLEKLYGKFGFQKISEDSKTMIWTPNK